jgi:uncharacterized membrane protein
MDANAAAAPAGARAPGMTLFEATIVPHRSLTARGLTVVLAVIGGLSCLTMTLMWLLGAWPVIGFSGVEIAVAILLIRLHARRTPESELVLLSETELRIIRTDAGGRREERALPPTWLQVVLQDRPGRVPALLLAFRGAHEEIGARLGADEKRDLAQALAAALHRMRNPHFDNPQLRE